ncbi:hypothetical protein GLYMA_08G194800v4 [Glycine max]|nr:hypothetical protein GLYMA_08G194800v4 [Glycine max]KAH1052067.1 hypothetical protein GYH30_021766 [Glycine max]
MLLGKCGPRKQHFFNNTSEFHASVQHFDVVSRECRSSHQHHKSYQPCFSSSATIGAQSSAWSQPQSSHPSFEVPRETLSNRCFFWCSPSMLMSFESLPAFSASSTASP